jgi:predicted Holliday junction resolvase-like endonuclease
MKNIPLIIFIVLFSFILLHSIYVRARCNRLIEGLESGSADMSMDDRFKKLEDRMNKMQEQIVEAEKTNEENAKTLKKLNSRS